jgi:hypothetical protein
VPSLISKCPASVSAFLTLGSLKVPLLFSSAQLKEHRITTPAEDLRSVAQNVIADPRYGFIILASTVEAGPVGIAYASCLLSLEHGGTSGWLEEL